MINTLAIECATKTASVAIVSEEKVIIEKTVNGAYNHSVTIIPMIDDIVKDAGFDRNKLDFITVSKGPGSYTGLRIGASIAKGLARVYDIPVVGVNTLQSLAYNFTGNGKVCSLIDARRHHAYSALYEKKGNELMTMIEPELRSVEEMVSLCDIYDDVITYLGDGSVSHKDIITDSAKRRFLVGGSKENTPYASNLGYIGIKEYKKGNAVDFRFFVPDYYRSSQAKRMLEEKRKGL